MLGLWTLEEVPGQFNGWKFQSNVIIVCIALAAANCIAIAFGKRVVSTYMYGRTSPVLMLL